MYVIRNEETKKFVTHPGSQRSYTNDLRQARVFHMRDQAEKEMCPENEAVHYLYNLLPQPATR